MVVVSYSGKEINAKLVYYGAGLSGKTTNLEAIYEAVPESSRGKMVSMKTQSDRTLFFDLLPLDLGEIMGFKTRFLLYTVPGQVFYNATRKLVLKGADAIVFVADSSPGKMDENKESLGNLRANLTDYGLRLDDIPWVLQYNKRDLPNAYTLEELNAALNPDGAVPTFEAVATQGTGVFETFRGVSHLVMQKVTRELHRSPQGTRAARLEETGPRPAVPERPAPPGTRVPDGGGGDRAAAPAPDLTADRDPFATSRPSPERPHRDAAARPLAAEQGAGAGEGTAEAFGFTRDLSLGERPRAGGLRAPGLDDETEDEPLQVESESAVSARLTAAGPGRGGAPLSRSPFEERTLTFDSNAPAPAGRAGAASASDVVVPIRITAGRTRQIVLRITIEADE